MSFVKAVGATIGSLIALVLIFVIAFGLSIGGIRLGGILQQEQADANRRATQHSQQYVETKQSLLLKLLTDYNDPAATDGQKEATLQRICQESTLIEPELWPGDIPHFVAVNC